MASNMSNNSTQSVPSAADTMESIVEEMASSEMFSTAPNTMEAKKVASVPETIESNIANKGKNSSPEKVASDVMNSNVSKNEKNASPEKVASDVMKSNVSKNEKTASPEKVASDSMTSNILNDEKNDASLEIMECETDEIYDPEYDPVKTHVNKWNVGENEEKILPKKCLELVPREVLVATWLKSFENLSQEAPQDITSTPPTIPKKNVKVQVGIQGESPGMHYVNKRKNAEKPIKPIGPQKKKKVKLYTTPPDTTIMVLDDMETEVPLYGESSKRCDLEKVDLYCDSSNDTVLVPDEIITKKSPRPEPGTSRGCESPILRCSKNIKKPKKNHQEKKRLEVEKDSAKDIEVSKTAKKVESTSKKTSTVVVEDEDSDDDVEVSKTAKKVKSTSKKTSKVVIEDEDSDDDDEVFQTKKKQTSMPKVFVAKGSEYTQKENKLLCQYAFNQKIYKKHVSGNAFWKKMESENIVPGRSWQSLRARFLVVEKGRNFARYMEPEKAAQMIQKLQEMRAQKPK